jgi:hemerythrin-like domain-containing protein
MDTISRYLSADHARCDALFAQLETSVGAGHWKQAETGAEGFHQALERHFRMEEDVLFPAFEQATKSSTGPTGVMRTEHQHIRIILSRLSDAVGQCDTNDFFGHADTLRIMMHQHNLKEESILYVMTDRVLAGRQDQIIDAMDAAGEVGVLDTSN